MPTSPRRANVAACALALFLFTACVGSNAPVIGAIRQKPTVPPGPASSSISPGGSAAQRQSPPGSIAGTRAGQRKSALPGGASPMPVPQPIGPRAPTKIVLPLKPPPRSLLYGININWSESPGIGDWERDGGRHARQLLALMRIAGATHTRVPVRWADIERVRGHYDWTTLDRLIAQLKTQGLAVTGVVRSAPDWAIDSSSATRRVFVRSGLAAYINEQPPTAASYADWMRFATALGQHFKGAIGRWEVGYQPDGRGMPIVERSAAGTVNTIRVSGDAAMYTRLLKVFTLNVKRTDPGCVVAVGALSTPSTDFLQSIYGNGGRTAFDAVALCPAGSSNGLDFAWVDACRQVLVGRGDAGKDIWLAEWGWNSYPEEPEGLVQGHQARLLRSGLSAMRRRTFIQQADWKDLVDASWRGSEAQTAPGSGLCTKALRSKPAFAAFQKEAVPGLAAAKPPPRTLLVGGTSRDAETGAAHVDLDVSASAGALPAAWLGVHVTEPIPIKWTAIGQTLKGRSANWVRLNLFQSGWIRRSEDSGWAIDYAALDRILRNLATDNLNVIIQASAVPGMSTAERMAIVKSLALRYGTDTKYSVFRWEYAGQDDGTVAEYESFAQTVASIVPERPISFASIGPNAARDAEAVAKLCAQKRCVLSSFSWSIGRNSIETARMVRGIRDALSRYTALKGTMLTPSFKEPLFGVAGVSLVQRLLDFCPLEQPHGLLGILTPLVESVNTIGELMPDGGMMATLNRLRGIRLFAHSDQNSVRCIASKNGDTVQLLVWREDSGTAPLPWILRLRGLPDPAVVRIEQYAQGVSGAGSHAAPGTLQSDVPDAVADIRVQSGEAEALLRLEPGTISQLVIRPRRPPPLEITASTPKLQWYSGELLDVDCEVRNISQGPRTVDLELQTGAGPAAIPLKAALGSMAAGATRRVRFRPRVPNGHIGSFTFNVRGTGDVRSSVGIQIVPAVSVMLAAPRFDVDSAGVARVKMLVTNRGHAPLPITVRIAGRSNALSQEITVPGDGKQLDQILMLRSPSKDAGCYPIEIAFDSVDGRVATATTLIGVPIECRYASLKPRIDGDLSEWTDSDPIGMGRADQVHEKSWRGPTDLSAYAYLRWDEQFLYVACAVTDDVLFAPFPAAEMLKGDSVQFAFSPDRRLPATPNGYGPTDHEFGMALLDGLQSAIYRFAGNGGVGPLIRGAVTVKRSGSRIFYEAAVPWSELGSTRPREGTLAGFSIRVNDNDGLGGGYMAWGDGLSGDKRPLLFPPVKFVR